MKKEPHLDEVPAFSTVGLGILKWPPEVLPSDLGVYEYMDPSTFMYTNKKPYFICLPRLPLGNLVVNLRT